APACRVRPRATLRRLARQRLPRRRQHGVRVDVTGASDGTHTLCAVLGVVHGAWTGADARQLRHVRRPAPAIFPPADARASAIAVSGVLANLSAFIPRRFRAGDESWAARKGHESIDS